MNGIGYPIAMIRQGTGLLNGIRESMNAYPQEDPRTPEEKLTDLREDMAKVFTSLPATQRSRAIDIHLVNLETQDKASFIFVPKEVAIEPTIKLSPIDSMGRNLPLYHYTGGAKTISLDIDWFQMKEDQPAPLDSAKFIESLGRNNGKAGKLPRLKLIWGNTLFADAVWVLGECPYKLRQFNGLRDKMPMSVIQSIKLYQISETNTNTEYIRRITT